MYPLVGLILCGGQSSRMGEDKCRIRYHTLPQWLHLAELLRPLCEEVLISCSTPQLEQLTRDADGRSDMPTLLADSPHYVNHGPMSGLLTAWDARPAHSLLVAGCDYPLLTAEDFGKLISARKSGCEAVCFKHRDMMEPLVAVYESSAEIQIRRLFEAGEYSLRSALTLLRSIRIVPTSPSHLLSIDTPEQRAEYVHSNRTA